MKTNKLNRAVFLDRDGVINHAIVRDGKPYAPRMLTEFQKIPGVDIALQNLKENGFLTIIVTNQPDVGNGFVSKDFVESLHLIIKNELLIDDIKVCYHNQKQNCLCRKPKPGLILEAAIEYDINLSRSVMIGDRLSDIIAGKKSGCYTVFLDYGYSEHTSQDIELLNPNLIAHTLSGAVELLLRNDFLIGEQGSGIRVKSD